MGSLPPQENGCVVLWRAKCCTTLWAAPFITLVLREISDTPTPLLYRSTISSGKLHQGNFYTSWVLIHETTSERAHILKTQRGSDTVTHLFPRENNGTRPKNNLKIVFICNNCRFLIFNFTTSFLLLLIWFTIVQLKVRRIISYLKNQSVNEIFYECLKLCVHAWSVYLLYRSWRLSCYFGQYGQTAVDSVVNATLNLARHSKNILSRRT